jgi:putative transposase
MARRARSSAGGEVFHVLNRGNCRMNIFTKPGDYAAFIKILEEGRRRTDMRVLAYCLMSNHWHLVLWPRRAEDLSRFMQWISTTHVRRWREQRDKVGEGHLYQGRFKSFPVQDDHHLLTVMRYAEANPLRAKMVEKAEAWRWSSLGRGTARDGTRLELEPWPVNRPADWLATVNEPISSPQLEKLRLSVNRGQPYGSDPWTVKIARRLGIESSLRNPWRPKKETKSKKPAKAKRARLSG